MGGVMKGDADRSEISGLNPSAAERIVAELGRTDGERVFRCLRTAEAMLGSAGAGHPLLRWAESDAYNLREALDSVVRHRSAGEGGLSAALSAWDRFKRAVALPDADPDVALLDLAGALDELKHNKGREALMARRLLAWIREQTGTKPLSPSSMSWRRSCSYLSVPKPRSRTPFEPGERCRVRTWVSSGRLAKNRANAAER